jgi:uncharacterized membrane protein
MSENPAPPPAGNEVSSDDRLWALLAYIFTPLVPIIILLMEDKKNRPFLKAHYMQALVLGIVLAILSTILAIIPIINFFIPIAWLVIVLLYGLKANRGESVTIPVITNFVKQQGWA